MVDVPRQPRRVLDCLTFRAPMQPIGEIVTDALVIRRADIQDAPRLAELLSSSTARVRTDCKTSEMWRRSSTIPMNFAVVAGLEDRVVASTAMTSHRLERFYELGRALKSECG